MSHVDLMATPPPVHLPENDEAKALLGAGDPEAAAATATRFPSYVPAWAALAEQALAGGQVLAGYAYARTGYHRSLDQLRRAGWRGTGPVPWEHEPNRGFLRSLAALGRAAAAIGEDDEAERCAAFLESSSPAAAKELGGELSG